MTSDAERILGDLGLEIEEYDFGRDDEPDVIGVVTYRALNADGYQATILIRPGASPAIRAMFANWVVEKYLRIIEHGPEPDGWQLRRTDGRWQLWARLVDMPPID